MLFGGSRRFTSSAASSTRSRPSHAIGVVSLVHTRVVAAGPDPEPHSGVARCRSAPPRLWLSSHRFQATRALQPDDGVPMELRDDVAGEASTASHSAGECQELEPNRESSAARTASPAPEELG